MVPNRGSADNSLHLVKAALAFHPLLTVAVMKQEKLYDWLIRELVHIGKFISCPF